MKPTVKDEGKKLASLEDILCLHKGETSVGETMKKRNVEFNQKRHSTLELDTGESKGFLSIF